MTTMTPPGQPRKTLAGQLDRLDDILDGLRETLQRAVADAVERVLAAAVQQAVAQAVQEVAPALLAALLNNAQLLTAHHGGAARVAPAASACTAVREACRDLGRKSRAAWRQVRAACAARLGQAACLSPLLAAAGVRLCRCKRRLLWACSMGLAAGLLVGWAGPWLGVTVGFAAGFLLALAAQHRRYLLPLLSELTEGG